MTSKKDVTDKVQRILANNFPTQLGRDGAFRIKVGSANVDVEVMDAGPNPSTGERDAFWVDVSSILVWGANGSSELFEYIATKGLGGGLSAGVTEVRDNPGFYNIHVSGAILGNFLDEDELVNVVAICALIADTQDDDLADRFGGRVSDPDGNRD